MHTKTKMTLQSPVKTDPRWKRITEAVTRLFELKRLPQLAADLPMLNDNVSALAKSELGPFISEYYRDHILTPCMNKLAQPLLVERDNALISKMVEVWVQFYTSILPTLLAIFVAVQPHQNKLSIRSLTLVSFRDCVVLKTKLAAAVQRHVDPLPPQIQQMLLVLQSVHHSPPGDNFFVLQDLVCVVVESYWPMVIRSQFKPESKRSIRAGTLDILDRPSVSPEKNSMAGRRHSLGRFDSSDETSEPVTRL